jgi:hypothetical protein
MGARNIECIYLNLVILLSSELTREETTMMVGRQSR